MNGDQDQEQDQDGDQEMQDEEGKAAETAMIDTCEKEK